MTDFFLSFLPGWSVFDFAGSIGFSAGISVFLSGSAVSLGWDTGGSGVTEFDTGKHVIYNIHRHNIKVTTSEHIQHARLRLHTLLRHYHILF